jgi:hypothetical protein
MLVSPATVTRVKGAGFDEHEVKKTGSKIEAMAKDVRLRVANVEVKTFITGVLLLGSWLNAVAERLDGSNPALFRKKFWNEESESRR